MCELLSQGENTASPYTLVLCVCMLFLVYIYWYLFIIIECPICFSFFNNRSDLCNSFRIWQIYQYKVFVIFLLISIWLVSLLSNTVGNKFIDFTNLVFLYVLFLYVYLLIPCWWTDLALFFSLLFILSALDLFVPLQDLFMFMFCYVQFCVFPVL